MVYTLHVEVTVINIISEGLLEDMLVSVSRMGCAPYLGGNLPCPLETSPRLAPAQP